MYHLKAVILLLLVLPAVGCGKGFMAQQSSSLSLSSSYQQGTPLVGQALNAFPYFSFVDSFNQGEVINLAIDPYKFPAIVGHDCLAFIVNPESLVESTALVDERSTGPQLVSFVDEGLEANTISLMNTSSLPQPTGADISVGFSLVLDCNQNAVLDRGDLVDGLDGKSGFEVFKDLSLAGDLAVTSVEYSGPGTFLDQIIYFPRSISSLGELPVVVISHGNGHNYLQYQYLQRHLASHGFVVMSHSNNTQPGIEASSDSILDNVDHFFGNLASIGSGELIDHVDKTRLAWIGHSRGGEGVVRAYDKIFDKDYVPTNFSMEDIKLVSSIAPTTFLTSERSNPHEVNYLFVFGSSDGDVTGAPNDGAALSFPLFERAKGERQSIYVHGAGHNVFNADSRDEGVGLNRLSRGEVHTIAKSYFLAAMGSYLKDHDLAKDYFRRMYESFHPLGIDRNVVIANEYRVPRSSRHLVIDDFESERDSSSLVYENVDHNLEGYVWDRLIDVDGGLAFTEGRPMNGMTRSRGDDIHQGVVFGWRDNGSNYRYTMSLKAEHQDFSTAKYLSLRAAQGTNHDINKTLDDDVSFSVTLIDKSGQSSSIDFSVFGGINTTYKRSNGTTPGWVNEFRTIRLQLTDFLHNGSSLNLNEISSVQFDFGQEYGSSMGYIGLDDIELTYE